MIKHVLSHGAKRQVNARVTQNSGPSPDDSSALYLGGPPALNQKAALPALRDWAYEERRTYLDFRGRQ